MKTQIRTLFTFMAFVACGLHSAAKEIPLQLPKPDGSPVDASKPVKVYILAGQSNMVGMGDISGARPPHEKMFLTVDPAIIPEVVPIGLASGGKPHDSVPVARHGLFDVKASIYNSPYDRTKEPARTVAVALGPVAEELPAIGAGQSVVVTALIEVSARGSYTVHAGFGESAHNVIELDGKEVYRKDIGGKPVVTKVLLESGKRYPVAITYFKGGSAAFWIEHVDILGRGDLEILTKQEKKFPYLLNDNGTWLARNDVFYKEARLNPLSIGSPLSVQSNNGKSIGPEVGFGNVMGTFHDEQVLLIKTAQGNRSLGFDFRPPSSGPSDATNEYEGQEYRMMVKGVQDTLNQIDKIVPDYKGQGYEIAGFAWFQGHKDSGASKQEYEKHLVNLINDLRKEFKSPKMPAVVATVGFHGYRIKEGPWNGIWEAQMAVGDPNQHPEFVGTVASVDTRDFWREVEESPRGQDYHYNRNPETYLLVGEAMGRAMVRMHGGEAVAIPKSSDRENQATVRAAAEIAEAAKPKPTAEQKAASAAALKPIILDAALSEYLSNPRNQPLLKAAVNGERPKQVLPLLGDALDEVADYYRAVGISDYNWESFGADITAATWEYYAFDLPETYDKTEGINDLKMTCPTGMENWFARDFDTKKAGWKSGKAPFGIEKDPITYPDWYGPSKRISPTTFCDKDVVLLRQNFALPPMKDGYRYRIRIIGSIHANSGEGYAIYVNGKLLAESKAGLINWRKEGAKPRGGHVFSDFRQEFKGGKVTLAVSNFPMNNRPANGFIPARAPLSVCIEEMKLPPVDCP